MLEEQRRRPVAGGEVMDYLFPTSRHIAEIESVILEDTPSPLNP